LVGPISGEAMPGWPATSPPSGPASASLSSPPTHPPSAEASAELGSSEVDHGPSQLERRTLRVSTERLDALMNLAGELVISRSRLVSRVQVLRDIHRELSSSRTRLVSTIDTFRSRYEFTLSTQPAVRRVAAQKGNGDGGKKRQM